MRKNVASQKIGAQLVSATDGSAFTGSVTVAVTGDAGTQATGSVGSGACTHEGGGYHTYAPAQAETNYDLVAFTFSGTGAVPVTVQVYTLPTTGLLAPATSGRTLVVDASGLADANMVKLGPTGSGTAQTARDIGASVLLSSGTGTGQVKLASGYVAPNWGDVGNPSTAVGLSGTTIKEATDVQTTLTNRLVGTLASGTHSPQSGDAYARLGAPAGASTSADIAAVKAETATIVADTGELQTNQGNWLTATGFSTHSAADVWAVGTRTLTAATNISAAIAAAVWEIVTSTLTSAGTIGKLLVDNINAAISTRQATFTSSTGVTLPATVPTAAQTATAVEAAILDEGDATALLAAISAKVEEFLINEGDATATLAAIATAVTSALGTGSGLTALATAAAQTTAQNDLDILTGSDGATLATAQANYAPAKAGDAMTLTSGERGSVADAVYDEALSGHTTAGTGGKALADILADTGTDGVAISGAAITALLTQQMTESYAANGTAPTLAQAMFAVHQMLMQFSISGTSYTVKKLDGSTTAFVVTLDDDTSPTGATRS